MAEKQLKYRWQHTWPDVKHDFKCLADGHSIGRVMRHDTGPMRMWTWFMSIDHLDRPGEARNGQAMDKIEACRQLEAAYDEVKAATS